MFPFVVEQPALARKAAAITGQRTVAADDAMTRHDNGDRVGAVREADGARRGRLAESGRERAVARGGSGGDLPQSGPDGILERRAGGTGRKRVDGSEVAVEISASAEDRPDGSRASARAPKRRAKAGRQRSGLSPNSSMRSRPCGIGDEKKFADGRSGRGRATGASGKLGIGSPQMLRGIGAPGPPGFGARQEGLRPSGGGHPAPPRGLRSSATSAAGGRRRCRAAPATPNIAPSTDRSRAARAIARRFRHTSPPARSASDRRRRLRRAHRAPRCAPWACRARRDRRAPDARPTGRRARDARRR